MKQVIIVLGIIVTILSVVYGAYMPLVKAQSYISALRNVQSVRSVDGFKTLFDVPISFYSPIGDEEVVKFLSNDILGVVSQPNQQEAVSRALVEYIEPHLFQTSVIHLLNGSSMRSILWQKHGRDEDYVLAEAYLKKAYAIGPKLPPVLYGLLNLYSLKEDKDNMQKIAKIILTYWPSDEKVKKLVQ
ncbi:MAG: hypothetical protein WCW78_02400 [Candidatus Paceibacterota bacterium]|jgi:hypothetical protein